MLNIFKNVLKDDLYFRLLRNVRGASQYPLKSEEPIWEGKNLEQTLQERDTTDPEISFKVDISLPPPPKLSSVVINERYKYFRKRKKDSELERKARTLSLEIDTDSIREEWVKENAPKHIQMVAEHYKIFDDLFGDAYFTPYVLMDIYFPQKNKDLVAPVYRGNIVKPDEAFFQPVIKFDSKPNELWTLTLVNPDAHFTEENMEYVHWFVGNIPGGDVSKGEIIWDYLPPFPPRGVGFQRLIFVLYKQEKKIDYTSLQKKIPCLELKDRSFNTLDFYRERQDDLTPAGLSFFQSDWDKTARKVFHEILNMEEPVFEYDFPPQYHAQQKWFPHRKPFNMYLDKYRDPRDINQEYLLRKLKEADPFKPPEKPFPYPRAIRLHYRDKPSWLVKKEEYFRMNKGRVTNLEIEEYE